MMNVNYQKKRYRADTFRVNGLGKGLALASGGTLTADSRYCDCGDGSLQAGIGLCTYARDGVDVLFREDLPQPDFFFRVDSEAALPERKDKLFFVSLEGKMYTYYEERWIYVYDFRCRVKGAWAYNKDGKKQYFFAGERGVYRLDAFLGMATSVQTPTADLCFYKDRLFCAVEPHSLVYSAPLAPNKFTATIDDGGEIALPRGKGDIVALLPMKNRLYLFYEYGIFVLDGAGTPRDFVVSEVGYGGGRIFGDSVGACAVGGEKAFFLADNGLYAFDGNKAERTCENLSIKPVCEGQVCVHAEFDGKYYLSFLNENNVREAVCVDGESGNGYVTFVVFGASVDGGVAFCTSDLQVKTFSAHGGSLPLGEEYVYKLSNVDFDCSERKVVKKLVLHGVGSVRVRLSGEGKTKEKTFDLTSGRAEAEFGLRGERFEMSICLQAGARVSALEAEYLTLKGNAKRRFT